MGVYYRWRCDTMKEYFDPGDILGPKMLQRGYGVKASSIPGSSWVVGALLIGRWYGMSVRLVGSGNDDYDCEGYEEVSQYVLRELIHLAPDVGLIFLASGLGEDVSGLSRELTSADRDRLRKVIRNYARVDWPPRCRDESCQWFGSRHSEACVERSRLPAPTFARRTYCLGLGSAVVEPGQVTTLRLETKVDLHVDHLMFSEGAEGTFTVERVRAGEVHVPIVDGMPAMSGLLGGLPLPINSRITLRAGMILEVSVKNKSKSRATIAGGATGSVESV